LRGASQKAGTAWVRFAGIDAGGERAAIFCTLIRTKLNGIEPETYPREVLTGARSA